MRPPFDIFRQENGGEVIWICIATTMEQAERKVAEAMISNPASYAIVSLRTGKQRIIPPTTDALAAPVKTDR